MRLVEYDDLQHIKFGDDVELVAGYGERRLKATAKIVKAPGSTGILIRLVTIHELGRHVTYYVDQELMAGVFELRR